MINMTMEQAKKNTEYLYTEAVEAASKGIFTSRPVDDIAIMAYGITKEELEPFYHEKYLNVHWSDILDEILEKRELIGA